MKIYTHYNKETGKPEYVDVPQIRVDAVHYWIENVKPDNLPLDKVIETFNHWYASAMGLKS